jgi:hypothetical protein
MRLIVINLVIILRSMWARHSGNGYIYACAYKFGWGEVGTGISRVSAVPTFLFTECPFHCNFSVHDRSIMARAPTYPCIYVNTLPRSY